MIYEVRNYHFKPELLDDYRAWARDHAVPYLGSKMEVVGFWVSTGLPAEVGGVPQDDLGPANVTWVIRWRDVEQRNTDWPAAIKGEVWEGIIAKVPGGMSSYIRTESKFADSLI